MPTMPVTAAGWRIEPPVSVPVASGASYAATAAEEPPDGAAGDAGRGPTGCGSVPYALFSVEEPIANSSMLVLPRITRPASRSRAVTVASYGGRQPSRILEPAVVGMSAVVKTSLCASGTPASGPSVSPRRALRVDRRAPARAPSRGRRAGTRDLAVDGLDPVQVRLGDLDRG